MQRCPDVHFEHASLVSVPDPDSLYCESLNYFTSSLIIRSSLQLRQLNPFLNLFLASPLTKTGSNSLFFRVSQFFLFHSLKFFSTSTSHWRLFYSVKDLLRWINCSIRKRDTVVAGEEKWTVWNHKVTTNCVVIFDPRKRSFNWNYQINGSKQ